MAEKPKKLPPQAYELKKGETYVPYTHGQQMTEWSVKAIITGAVLGVVFGMANTYLGLKAGLTISTSIPVAVLSIVVFKVIGSFGGKYSILETNMSQTVGSASSSVASGVLFTLPALFIWGMEPKLQQMALLAMSGGLLGVLAMIPLRRYLIARQHGTLPYPEGLACAEVQVAAEQGGKQATGVFWGIGLGMLVKIMTSGLKIIPENFSQALPLKAGIAAKVSPALIGVGYILGPRIASIMVAGSALSAIIIIPAIYLWGSDLNQPLYPETVNLIKDMSSGQLWTRYVRYIGAGAVATAGIITLIQSVPAMVESFKVGMEQLGKGRNDADVPRTDIDLPIKIVLAIAGAVLLLLTLVPGVLGYIDSVLVRLVASIMIAIFAFFFVTVSSRIVGMVGVTSNPTSGMTIATLIGTSLIFYLLGWTDDFGKATALMVGTVVCIAASIAGDTSQDLKTGYLLGATPKRQQIGELVGVITSAAFVCMALQLLHSQETLGSEALPAPQAALMKLVIDGVLDQQLPWNLVLIGSVIAIVAFLLKLPSLPFAVGVYLPLSALMPVFLGGMVRWFVTRKASEEEGDQRREQGVLFGSGLVGGEGLTGVLLAGWALVINNGEKIKGLGINFGPWGDKIVALLGVLAIMWLVAFMAKRRVSD